MLQSFDVTGPRSPVLYPAGEDIQTNYESIVILETTAESIEGMVQSNTTEIKNTQIEINDKFNNYATVETVTNQINSMSQKMTDTELDITALKETLENGVSKVKTETGYTFDTDGLNISSTNSKVNNTLNERGMTIEDNATGDTLLFAGYDNDLQETVVISKNLIVQKYLNIPHARFEGYNNQTFGEGAGCFYME